MGEVVVRKGREGGGVLEENSVLGCSSQSRPEHVGHVSVRAVDPQHQWDGEGHEGPGDALHACSEAAALGLLLLFTGLQVVPGRELEQLVQQDDGQGDLQHHQPLGQVEGGDLEDHLRGGKGVSHINCVWGGRHDTVFPLFQFLSAGVLQVIPVPY